MPYNDENKDHFKISNEVLVIKQPINAYEHDK